MPAADVPTRPPARSLPDAVTGAVAVGVAVLCGAWALLTGGPGPAEGTSFYAMPLTAAVGYGAVGTVLALHGRATVVRRVMLGIAVAQAVTGLVSMYADAGVAAAERWPLTSEAFWVGSWLWAPAYVAVLGLLPLLLPDGRALWRPALWLSCAALAWATLSWALTPYHLQDFPVSNGLVNPVGIDVAASPAVVVPGAVVTLSAIALSLASAVVRWRRSSGATRDQLVWLLLGVVATVLVAASAFLTSPAVGEVLSAAAMLPFPLACGVALLRHRLWDVDVVVSRSLLYGLLTGGAVALYVVAVALLGALLGSSSGAPVLATAAVALAVLPLHSRLQRVVNRLVHGDVQDPYAALARLGDRLEAAAEPSELAEHVLPELLAQVTRVLRVPGASIALADGSRTVHGSVGAAVTRTPLVFAGQEVGALEVASADLPRTDRRLLEALGRQAAVAVHSVLLARDVQRARATTATAREEERRRLRRDLHDGMGPALAALALQAETARDLVAVDPEAATRLLDRLVPHLNGAVSEVRTLVHDLRPPTLDELGLAGAVRELAARFATPSRTVRVSTGELGDLPAAVDLAAYRIVAEALTNAAKHADARVVDVVLARHGGELVLTVDDDGSGMSGSGAAGVGLRSMRERADELSGRCSVGPGPLGGTRVEAHLPLPAAVALPQQREEVLV